MGMPVAELQRRMSSMEFTEWMAFHNLEPFGPRVERFDRGLALSQFHNANRRKNSKSLQPEDFFPELKPEPKKLTRKEILARRHALEAMMGSTNKE